MCDTSPPSHRIFPRRNARQIDLIAINHPISNWIPVSNKVVIMNWKRMKMELCDIYFNLSNQFQHFNPMKQQPADLINENSFKWFRIGPEKRLERSGRDTRRSINWIVKLKSSASSGFSSILLSSTCVCVCVWTLWTPFIIWFQRWFLISVNADGPINCGSIKTSFFVCMGVCVCVSFCSLAHFYKPPAP